MVGRSYFLLGVVVVNGLDLGGGCIHKGNCLAVANCIGLAKKCCDWMPMQALHVVLVIVVSVRNWFVISQVGSKVDILG